MPGTSRSSERVAIKPSTHGILISAWVLCAERSGMPNTAKPAGAGSVSHIASIAAIFICWFSVAV